MKLTKFLYDLLYDEADTLLKIWNPCKIKSGNCAGNRREGRPDPCCCNQCSYLDPEAGCTIQSLGCKLFLCGYAEDAYPYLSARLQELRSFMRRNSNTFFIRRGY